MDKIKKFSYKLCNKMIFIKYFYQNNSPKKKIIKF